MGDTGKHGLNLGSLVKDYQGSRAQIIKILIVALISGGVALIFFTAAVLDTQNGLAGKIGFSVIGALFSLPVIVGAYTLLKSRGVSVSLYENGLVYRRAGKEFVTTWNEIASYMQETACRITKKDGEMIEFGANIRGADEVAQRIQAETLKIMLPQVKATILQGSSVQFKGVRPGAKIPLGKTLDQFAAATSGFTVDAGGITSIDGGNRVAWKDATGFGVAEEVMARGKAGKHTVNVFFIQDGNVGLRTRLGLLENAHVLLALCGEMVTLKDGEGTPPQEKLFPVEMPQRLERIRRNLLIAVGVLFAVVLVLIAFIAVAGGLLWGWDSNKKPKIIKNQVGMEFMPISAGSFMMGSEKGRDDEKPVHQVTITKAFLMGRYEVTSAQWKAVMGKDPSNYKGQDFPVQFVSWNDAQEFIRRLNEKNDGYIYRLPTEAEWEYACRAATSGDMTYYEVALDKIHTVAYRHPNDWGIYDMQGNVSEWCQDWYEQNYYGQSPAVDPQGPASGQQRVKRGGSWYDNRSITLSSAREGQRPDQVLDSDGFRVVAVARNH